MDRWQTSHTTVLLRYGLILKPPEAWEKSRSVIPRCFIYGILYLHLTYMFYLLLLYQPLMDLCMIFLLHLVDSYGTCIGKYTSPMESVTDTGLATFLLAWLATGYRASFHASGLPDTLRLVSYRVYPSKILQIPCEEMFGTSKGRTSGRIWGYKHRSSRGVWKTRVMEGWRSVDSNYC